MLPAHRPAVAITPGKRAIQDIVDEAYHAAREMRQNDVEELIGAVGGVTLKRCEARERFSHGHTDGRTRSRWCAG